MTILTKLLKISFTFDAFFCCITNIFCLTALYQVSRPNTLRSVASVHEIFSPISVTKEPCSVMGINLFALGKYSTVSSPCSASYPEPTGVGFINVRPKSVLEGNSLRHTVESVPQETGKVGAKCDDTLWTRIYHPKRLVVKQACATVTGTIVDASHGKNKDGARHEADGDGHFWLKLDPGQESFLNSMNVQNEGGNLVFEPVCRYRVTQKDALEACKNYKQPLVVPPVGSHVRMTGAFVLDAQHGHQEIHPVSSIDVLK